MIQCLDYRLHLYFRFSHKCETKNVSYGINTCPCKTNDKRHYMIILNDLSTHMFTIQNYL